MSTFQSAFDAFMAEAFEDAVISSTRAGWGGGGYSVELFEDGTYRVLDDNSIGNRYKSPGIIIGVPQIDDDDWNEEAEAMSYFGNALEEMQEKFSRQ